MVEENAKKFIREIVPDAKLYRDPINGIAWVEDAKAGICISVHPNIDITGSVQGMKERGFWGMDDRIVKSHGLVYNIDRFVCSPGDKMEEIVARECRCQACLERREKEDKKNG